MNINQYLKLKILRFCRDFEKNFYFFWEFFEKHDTYVSKGVFIKSLKHFLAKLLVMTNIFLLKGT